MRRLAVTACLCLLLAGCSSSESPQAALQTKMNAITQAANDKNAAELRGAVDDFLQEVRRQSANADISLTKAQDLQTIATLLLTHTSQLEEVASPTPLPSPSESPSPSPSPSPAEASPTSAPSPIIEVSSSPAGGVLSPAASP